MGVASTDLPEDREAIFDYFAAQIFARVPEATQRFLVTTAFLPQVPVSIARELTGNEDCRSDPRRSVSAAPVHASASGRGAGVLVSRAVPGVPEGRADAVLGTGQIHELLSRAARLLEATGAFDDAFELFREAADWPAAARADRAACVRTFWRTGAGRRCGSGSSTCPRTLLEAHPWLRYWLGASLIPVDQPDARRQLERAFEQFGQAGMPTGQALCAAGIIDAYFFEWTDFRPMRRWVDALDELIDRAELPGSPAVGASDQREHDAGHPLRSAGSSAAVHVRPACDRDARRRTGRRQQARGVDDAAFILQSHRGFRAGADGGRPRQRAGGTQ